VSARRGEIIQLSKAAAHQRRGQLLILEENHVGQVVGHAQRAGRG
jgi:hypothetical protein